MKPWVIVSGGDGGYGNLGDEFLLEATRRFYLEYQDRYTIAIAMANPPIGIDDGFTYFREDAAGLDALEVDVSRIALLHYYGGGYLNALWFEPKMTLYRHLVSSGLAAEKVAFTGLGVGPFEGSQATELGAIARESLVFGTRDRATVDGVSGTLTFDESIALYSPAMTRRRPAADHGVALNFRTGEYIGLDDAGSAALVDSLERYLTSRGSSAIAFGMVRNDRFDEGARIGKAIRSVASSAIRLVQRPAGFEDAADRLAACRVAITTSYHVALVSLYVGTPVIALCATDYYRLKFAGLAEVLDTPLLRVVPLAELCAEQIDGVTAAATVPENLDRLRATLIEMSRLNHAARDTIAVALA